MLDRGPHSNLSILTELHSIDAEDDGSDTSGRSETCSDECQGELAVMV